MRNIISFFPREGLAESTDLFRIQKNITYSGAGNSSSKAVVLSDLLRDEKIGLENVLWVTSDSEEQNTVKKAMDLCSDRPVFLYTKKADEERLTYATSADYEIDCKRDLIEFVLRASLNKKAVFIVNFQSLLQNFPDVGSLERKKITIKKDEELNSVDLIERLVSVGYEVTDNKILKKGQYYKVGDSIFLYPINSETIVRLEVGFNQIEKIVIVDGDDYTKEGRERSIIDIYPIDYDLETENIMDLFGKNGVIIDDEVDVVDEYYEVWNSFMEEASKRSSTITFASFNEDTENHKRLHYLSVLRYRSGYDLANDLRDKMSNDWKIIFFTKNLSENRALLVDQAIPFMEGIDKEKFNSTSVFLIEVEKEDAFPQSFQNPTQKTLLITDVDIALVRSEKRSSNRNIFDDFLTSLKTGDYVVHADHGIAKFLGLDRKTIDNVTKEYLKLGYAENDKLFVPIDQADKVNKYIGSDELMPKLTRLGSAEWDTITSRVKKETQAIAKELLKLYAERKAAKGFRFKNYDDLQVKFEKTFVYEETPGQIKAINDVKADMESDIPMDRLVCGDVGFGKTEVAMRAAFKAAQSGKQVAMISPITIFADQHFKSFKKRMEDFNVRVDMLSRFKSQKEQKEIVEKLGKGEVDIIIGTHRLLQPDVKFKNLGLVIVDEEQRFGVKQKEKLKELRKEVDILTLTATPIPRTLNICLSRLRDITTITTPPYGRLPIITEVRKYSSGLVREAIIKELSRKGQVYFLHNRVQTIDSFADKLKALVPEARFVVAHGKLGSGDLEERIMSFKNGEYDVLVSSTIIENGIDLENANTLIVNNAEKFGLAQLYQLRGRVGRGKRQAYAYFLYHGQRLKLDAKKRLRAIVEASELGSGFQIAMKDLEIRGAGDILGANQHGVINVVGVSHFMRMLNKAVEDLKAGRVLEGEEETWNVSIELPIPAYIPDSYIPNSKDKINAYQKLSSADNDNYLKEIKGEFVEDYGKLPTEVNNLFKIIELKLLAKRAGLVNLKSETVPMSKEKEIVLSMSKKVKPANIINMLEYNPRWVISGSKLKINLRDLGHDWFTGLMNSVDSLAKRAKHAGEGKSSKSVTGEEGDEA